MALTDYIDVDHSLMIDPNQEISEFVERSLRPVTDFYFQAKIIGHEHLPSGSALMVGNHGLYGYDAIIFIAKLFNQTGRMPRAIADHNFFRIPFLRESIALLGLVDGNQENAIKLLQDGELALVFPGGAREALCKEQNQPYKLFWENSDGFVKAALQSGAPLVPVAGIGPDDALSVIAEHEQVRKTPFGRLINLILGNKYIPSIALGLGPLPIPKRIPFTYYIGKPTYLDYPAEAAQDQRLVKRLKRNFQKRLERLIQKGLENRE